MSFNISSIVLHVLFLAIPVLAGHAQFFDKASSIGFALSTANNGSSTDLLFQISAPQHAGWGAVGTGERMDGSLMFIIYPSGQSNEVTVSARTSSGHDTPAKTSDIAFIVQSSAIRDSIMTANVLCMNCTKWPHGDSIDITSTKQPWIYAAGPGQPISSSSQDAYIAKHSTYGVFFIDMTTTKTTSNSIPGVSGTANLNTIALPGSVAGLIILHAICLGGPFVILFPLGTSLLRFFNSFRFHWMLQIAGTVICIIGLAVAVALSVMDVEYDSFGAAHQIIGILAVAALVFQVVLGYMHHQSFQKIGRRTWISHAHVWTGRSVIIVGMLNAVLGFSLAKSTAGAIGVAILAVVILVGTFVVNFLGERRRRAKERAMGSLYSSQTALGNSQTALGGSQTALDDYVHPYEGARQP